MLIRRFAAEAKKLGTTRIDAATKVATALESR
jgi:hypothetical protein